MNKKDELELFYILPYTKVYTNGGYYKNDDTGCIDYKTGHTRIWPGSPLFFEEKEQLLKWFYVNNDKPIPKVYRIKYLSNYKGLDDVFKITDLANDATRYYKIIDKYHYVWFDMGKSESCEKNVWQLGFLMDINGTFRFENIYEEFDKRGIKIKNKSNLNKKNKGKIKGFDFIGDPFSEKAKGKKLVLYKESLRGW